MGGFWLGWRLESIADALASAVAAHARDGRDPFEPATVVVPNRHVKRWLQLHLARAHGVTTNVHYLFLEEALWARLARLDARPHPPGFRQPAADAARLRLMVLAVLLRAERDAPAGVAEGSDLAPLVNYVRAGGDRDARGYSRHAWQLASRLAAAFRDYEYHRQPMIARWRGGGDATHASPDANPHAAAMERAQRAVYRQIFGDGGLRDLLGDAAARPLTLPEYAAAVLADGAARRDCSGDGPLHVVALANESPFHSRLLCDLATHFDVRIYTVSPLVGLLDDAPGDDAGAQRRLLLDRLAAGGGGAAPTTDTPVSLWGAAARETLRRMATAIGDAGKFAFHRADAPVRAPDGPPAKLLHAFQRYAMESAREAAEAMVSHSAAPDDPSSARVPQDCSLQLLACPGVHREAETVVNSVLHNLRADPTLRPADVAVLVTDMRRYRAAIESAFSCRAHPVPYNLTDFGATGTSVFGQAVLGLLDLAWGRFCRTDVGDLLLNPCVMARLGVERGEAEAWVNWARALHVCHSFDRHDKHRRGYLPTDLFTWHLAMQRLRLGRVFDRTDSGGAGDAEAFGGVVPYADLASGDAESAGRFCETIERLHHRLGALRELKTSCAGWRDAVSALIDDFLAVPAEHPCECDVRAGLLRALDEFATFDALRAARAIEPGAVAGADVDLHLVRQHLRDHLDALNASVGQYLVGGVTVAPLQSVRPIPFRVVYVMGLGEGGFPGQSVRSAIDLRSVLPHADDAIRPPDVNRGLFLDAILSARDKLYLSYVSRDLQRDQAMYPSSVVNQLVRLLNAHVVAGGAFRTIEVPLACSDARYLGEGRVPAWTDALVNDSPADRLVCLIDPANAASLDLTDAHRRQAEAREDALRSDFRAPPDVAAGATATPPAIEHVRVKQLKKFLQSPIEAAVQRHLRLYDEADAPPQDDEPFYSVFPATWQAQTTMAGCFAAKAATDGVDAALRSFDADFDAYYRGAQVTGAMPEGPFGEVDAAAMRQKLRASTGTTAEPGPLARFIAERAGAEYVATLVVGEMKSPGGAPGDVAPAKRFPTLRLRLPNRGTEVRLNGSIPFVWQSADLVEALVVTGKGEVKNLTDAMLDAFLTLTAARAGDEPGEGGEPSSAWLGGRSTRIHVLHGGGIRSWTYLPVQPAAARNYLAHLCADLLDQQAFQLLPFDVVVGGRKDYPLHTQEPITREMAKAYRQFVTDKVEADLENQFKSSRRMELLDLIAAEVPPDAYALARRRLGPLADHVDSVGGKHVADAADDGTGETARPKKRAKAAKKAVARAR